MNKANNEKPNHAFKMLMMVLSIIFVIFLRENLIAKQYLEDLDTIESPETKSAESRKLWQFYKQQPIENPTKKAVKKPEISPFQLEKPILQNFSKPVSSWIDLDDVKPGNIWVPISIDRFVSETEDPLIKMCQLNYEVYSREPWKLPMGNLLNVYSKCDQLMEDHVKILHYSVLEEIIERESEKFIYPTGFIYHETRCGSTLVANMLSSIPQNIIWSESTAPWKVLHTCKDCQFRQIVKYMRLMMTLMGRKPNPAISNLPNKSRLFFKLQSSEGIEIISKAFPDVPWMFLFREPVEVMISRLGAQRLGMEGKHDLVTKNLKKLEAKRDAKKQQTEVKHANTLAQYCKLAIKASEMYPGKGLMVEYSHLPSVIWDVALPKHFNIKIDDEELEALNKATNVYSKATESDKTGFKEDTKEKHDIASESVKLAAENILGPLYNELQSMQTWLK